MLGNTLQLYPNISLTDISTVFALAVRHVVTRVIGWALPFDGLVILVRGLLTIELFEYLPCVEIC